MLALADVLQDRARASRWSWPARCAALRLPRPDRRIRPFAPPGDAYRTAEVAVVLDTGTWNQLGDFGPSCARWRCRKWSSTTT